jgi:hypothetical protein
MFLQNPFVNQVGTADANSAMVTIPDNLSIANAGLQVSATSFNTADATVKVQHSNDPTFADWGYVQDNNTGTDAVITITSNISFYLIMTNISFKYYRLAFAKGTNSAGTFTARINFN